MFREGPEEFQGGMSAGKYATITGASPATTTRDLADLAERDALIREGERRHARYKLNVPLRHAPHTFVNERGEVFEE
jgi:Fic family protein